MIVCYLQPMRLVIGLAVVALAGCIGPSSSGECTVDTECEDGDVCARDKLCTAPANVRALTVTWTIRGAAADETSCAAHPDLFLHFLGRDFNDTIGFAPVPCRIGQFYIDKLPTRFREVELGVDGGASQTRAIGSGSSVAVDLR